MKGLSPLSASSPWWKMIEQAREELQKLEARHPKRFDSLKSELRSFISLLESNINARLCHPDDAVSLPPCTTATSQASTCRKRKKVSFREQEKKVMEVKKEALEDDEDDATTLKSKTRRCNRVEAVLERAQVCLRKIRELKTNF